MTCIVGYLSPTRTVVLGGDSCASSSNIRYTVSQPKVFKKGEFLIGYTSSFRFGQLVEHDLELPYPAPGSDPLAVMMGEFIPKLRHLLKEQGFSKVENNVETGGQLIVGLRGRLFEVQDDFSVLEHKSGYCAVGSGADFALGSLHTSRTAGAEARDAVMAALRAAEAFAPGVMEPFTVLEAG